MIRRILMASAGAFALTGAALGADLPAKAPPPVYLPPPPPLWTGFYAGLNAGGTWSNSNTVNITNTPGFIATNASAFGVAVANTLFAGGNSSLGVGTAGFIGGGQIGYNYQFGTSWLAGIEADIQGSTARGSTNAVNVLAVPSPPAPAGVIVTTALSDTRSLDYFGTVRGRLGFLFTPTLLVYGTGGFAYGGVSASTFIAQTVAPLGLGFIGFPIAAGSFSNTRAGWSAGGGLEWLFAPNWSVKVEYLYYDLGTVTQGFGPLVSLVPAALPNGIFSFASPTFRTRFNGNIVRAGINYHFNWGYPAPVVATY